MSAPSSPTAGGHRDAPRPTSPRPDEHAAEPTDIDELITHLRATLSTAQTLLSSQATRLAQLADLEEEVTSQRDQITFLTAAKSAVESQLKDEAKKREAAEETVELLRGQVEAARRGVMTLQKQDKERKRMSVLGAQSPTLSWAAGEEDTSAEPSTSKASKRTSMMVKSHKRQSSQSETADVSQTVTAPTPVVAKTGIARTQTRHAINAVPFSYHTDLRDR